MKQNSVVAISKSLHVTRTRVYQIIRKLEKRGTIKKNKDGKYILDDQAVNTITKFYKDSSKSFTTQQKLLNSEKRIQALNSEVKELKEKQSNLQNSLKVYKDLVEAKEQTIQALKGSKKDSEAFTEVMKKALDSLNKEQGLSYIDKVEKLPQDTKKQTVVADNDEKKKSSVLERIKNAITPKKN